MAPEACEHLGLVALDCFAYSVVPVLFHRSGASMLIDEGKTGWNFASYEELASVMAIVQKQFGTPEHVELLGRLREASEPFSPSSFRGSLQRIIGEVRQEREIQRR